MHVAAAPIALQTTTTVSHFGSTPTVIDQAPVWIDSASTTPLGASYADALRAAQDMSRATSVQQSWEGYRHVDQARSARPVAVLRSTDGGYEGAFISSTSRPTGAPITWAYEIQDSSAGPWRAITPQDEGRTRTVSEVYDDRLAAIVTPGRTIDLTV